VELYSAKRTQKPLASILVAIRIRIWIQDSWILHSIS